MVLHKLLGFPKVPEYSNKDIKTTEGRSWSEPDSSWVHSCRVPWTHGRLVSVIILYVPISWIVFAVTLTCPSPLLLWMGYVTIFCLFSTLLFHQLLINQRADSCRDHPAALLRCPSATQAAYQGWAGALPPPADTSNPRLLHASAKPHTKYIPLW